MLSHVWALSGAASRQWEWPATQLAALRAVRSPQTESSGCERVRVAVPVRSGRGARYILYILWSDAGLLTGNRASGEGRHVPSHEHDSKAVGIDYGFKAVRLHASLLSHDSPAVRRTVYTYPAGSTYHFTPTSGSAHRQRHRKRNARAYPVLR